MKTIAAESPTALAHGESGLSERPWQLGLFVQGGFPPAYEIHFGFLHYGMELELFSAGMEAGKQTRRYDGLRPFRGRGEAMLEIVPFWLARYPPQMQVLRFDGSSATYSSYWNGQAFHGASITPFLLRWNFSQRNSARVVPWAQLGGGLLWTNHKFPAGADGTSVINFTPQVGAGVNIFNRPKHSVNFAIKAIHISNASLGDHNPGLNQTLQFSAGYSWWK
jgi:hypothetical protein